MNEIHGEAGDDRRYLYELEQVVEVYSAHDKAENILYPSCYVCDSQPVKMLLLHKCRRSLAAAGSTRWWSTEATEAESLANEPW